MTQRPPKIIAACVALALAVSASITPALAEELPADLLGRLKDEEFKNRENAQAALLEWARKHANLADGLLFDYCRSAKDPEQKARCMEVLKSLVVDQYLNEGKGFIGVHMQEAKMALPGTDKELMAVRISEILPGMAAEKAGLRVGDMMFGVNGQSWSGRLATESMRDAIMNMNPGTVVKLQVVRDGKLMEVEVTLCRKPIWSDNLMLQQSMEQAEAAEQAARDAYFRTWMEKRQRGN